jgi:oxygen-dependent protoporphyrinogen oxidase
VTRLAVIGGGIAGLAAAHRAVTMPDVPADDRPEVDLFEAGDRAGGRIDSITFAGVDGIDLGADAVLARVPDATGLAAEVGLGDELVSPEPVGAAVWYDGLHDIPDGLVLGVPGHLAPLARSGLLSWRGKLRAGLEPLLPRTSLEPDSIGAFIRARFGDEVHERLVDPLVGGIYATDTDHFSLAEVPQLDALARHGRSVLLAARAMRQPAGTATAAASPVFATPRGGMRALIDATADAVTAAGARIHLDAPVTTIEPDGHRWRLNAHGAGDRTYDAVIVATPAAVAASSLQGAAPGAAALLGTAETADVAMLLLHVAAEQWPERLRGRSGYLVPKPVQRSVTAASFGSQKWAHWRPPAGGEILRVSIGRDGAPALHLGDDELLDRALDDLELHLGRRLIPIDHRVVRWPGAFAQYRPHHRAWVDRILAELPPGVHLAGSSYGGIGIPACVRDGRRAAERAALHVAPV